MKQTGTFLNGNNAKYSCTAAVLDKALAKSLAWKFIEDKSTTHMRT